MFRQRNWTPKYKNVSTIYEGIQYHSKAESIFASELDLLKKAGEVQSWERQIPIELVVNGKLICKYYCDFLVHYTNGNHVLVEVKGMETEVYRLKRKLLEATYLIEHPEYSYLVVKV